MPFCLAHPIFFVWFECINDPKISHFGESVAVSQKITTFALQIGLLQMKRKLFTVLVLVFAFAFPAMATHQRAAEITYKWLGGNAYEFTLTCYTYTPSPAGVQRDSLYVSFGDGSGGYMPRLVYQPLGDNYTLNVYKAQHDYSSAGTYKISMEDANRNYGVVNVPNSVMVPMYIETELVINPFLGFNNSVQLLNAPVDKGCVGKLYLHNPSAYDPDGDSLSFKLVPCRGAYGELIPGYDYPQASNSFEIDALTGELRWVNPVLQGEYNVAFMVEEWRGGVKIGSVVRDMQILISACDNDLPQIHCEDSYCVEAGQQLVFSVEASDPNGDNVILTASGAPFEVPSSPAYTSPDSPIGLNPSFEFVWNTDCSHVRRTPYQMVVRAKDYGSPVSLTNMKTVNVSVLGPKVQQLNATPRGNSVTLDWARYDCQNAAALRIYRHSPCDAYQPEPCETGIRAGYQLVAEIDDITATSFVDDNNGSGLVQGVDYGYRVVAIFHDGAESVPSEEVCVMLKNDLPLMTHVSNESDDLESGHAFVDWTKPIDIDAQFVAPFSYRLTRYLDGNAALVYQGTDTLFHDNAVDLSTATSIYYKVQMFDARQTMVGESTPAYAIALHGTGAHNRADLAWDEFVDWTIDSTQVFRKVENHFVRIATTASMTYSDLNVVDDEDYYYYVRTFGHYGQEGITRPLINYSAIIVVTPGDDEAPSAPILEVETHCEEVSNLLQWHGNTESDLAGFRIYYSGPSQTDYNQLTIVNNPGANSYLHDGLESVMGCYYVRAFDEKGNLSQPSDTICIDKEECPIYELPNVFTPNGDGFNDTFEPKHVQLSIIEQFKIVVFNRWGNVVFETTDPLLDWDGKDRHTRLDCSQGTYFYICDLSYQGVTGTETMRLQGSITLIR